MKSPNVSRCEAKRRRSERSRRRQLRPRQRCLKLPVPCFDDHIATPAGAMAPAGGLICAKCRFAEFTFVSVVGGVGEETQSYWPSCCCTASKRLARNRFRRPAAGATAGSCFLLFQGERWGISVRETRIVAPFGRSLRFPTFRPPSSRTAGGGLQSPQTPSLGMLSPDPFFASRLSSFLFIFRSSPPPARARP